MTAFEILLNEFYNTIIKNKPEQKNQSTPNYSIELKKVIKRLCEHVFYQWA
jgi:hypothetical protein